MNGALSLALFFTLVSVNVADDDLSVVALPVGLDSRISQLFPCFPICPPDVGKRGGPFSKRGNLVKSRGTNKFYPKFHEWPEAGLGPSRQQIPAADSQNIRNVPGLWPSEGTSRHIFEWLLLLTLNAFVPKGKYYHDKLDAQNSNKKY